MSLLLLVAIGIFLWQLRNRVRVLEERVTRFSRELDSRTKEDFVATVSARMARFERQLEVLRVGVAAVPEQHAAATAPAGDRPDATDCRGAPIGDPIHSRGGG